MVLKLAGRISAGDELLDTDLRHIGILEGAAGPHLYAATGQSGGLSVYRIDADGRLASLADNRYFSHPDMDLGRFDIVEADGAARLVLHGVGEGALVGYAIEEDGTLAEAASTDLPGARGQTAAAVASCALPDGRAALYMVDAGTGAIDAFLTDGKGGITAEATLHGQPAHYQLDGDAVLTVAETGGKAILLAADAGSHGVSSYRIDGETGALTRAATLGAADGLGLAHPAVLETVTAHGRSWAVLAATGSSSISVMELAPDGGLRLADHVVDTRATRFAAVTALEVIEADGHAFVLAGGADDGLSLLSLLPDGRLVHLQSLAHEGGLGLENVTGIEAVRSGGQIQVFVTSGATPGLTQFSIDLDRLGAVLDGSDSAAGSAIAGTGAGDVILGAGGRPLLAGAAGDDILVSGSGGAVMEGGAGNDAFVLSPTGETLRILDFERGADRLDLSLFPMLRSLDQLGVETISNGAWVRFDGIEIKVLSADGAPLTAVDIWPEGFDTPDRFGLPDAPPEPAGTAGDDVLKGGAGRDELRGLEGDDVLVGRGGRDRLDGNAGGDTLKGGAGKDRLEGGPGDDRLIGGKNGDRLSGGDGADLLKGQGGGDRLKGHAGDDVLKGGSGNDRLAGGGGDDRLIGQAGQDVLKGGSGRDLLRGGGGDDVLAGQAGKDRLIGAAGADILKGGGAGDLLEGGSGNDRLAGGKGRDRFVFGADHGDDYIADFNPDQDRIRLDIAGLGFDDLEIRAAEEGVEIDTGDGTILLEGVDAEELDPEHFLFP